MSTAAHINEPMVQVDRVHGPRLVGMWQKAVIGAWALVWLVSLVIFLLAIYYWFLWDSTPAAQIPQFFPTITPADQNSLLGYQEAIRQAGLSLVLYGGLFAVLRLISGLPYFVLSTLIVRRRSDRLMVVLFAIVLVVIGTAGRWVSANWNAAARCLPLEHYRQNPGVFAGLQRNYPLRLPGWAFCSTLDAFGGNHHTDPQFFSQHFERYCQLITQTLPGCGDLYLVEF